MSPRLKAEHYGILYTLLQNPKISINSLQKELKKGDIELSYHLVKKHIDELKRWGVLKNGDKTYDPIVPGNTREISSAEGNHNPDAIGLKRIHLFLHDLPKDKDKEFARICNLHPYTNYRAVSVSNGLSAYAKFDFPVSAIDKFERFAKKLKDELGPSSFQYFTTQRRTKAETNLKRWNGEINTWDFNIYDEKRKDSLEYYWANNHSSRKSYISVKDVSYLNNLDYFDFQLIRELNINAKVKNNFLAEVYNKDPSTISKRIKFLEENIMDTPTLYYKSSQFGHSLPQILLGKVYSPDDIDTLHQLMDNNIFPFRSTLISEEDNFAWIMIVPMKYAAEIAYFVWSKVKELQSFQLAIENNNSWRYPLYPNNFDEATHSWKTDDNYIIEEPFLSNDS